MKAAVALAKSKVPKPQTQPFLIFAQDPSVRVAGRILTATVEVPAEELAPGPRGYRVFVVDYDSSKGILYPPADIRTSGRRNSPNAAETEALVDDPSFHAQNVYAIVMRTLARFEFALGRRVSWSFDGHQIHVAPHAFPDANAFYSKPDRGLFFGYFVGEDKRTVFTCLAHDVIAHETTHALVDGLRQRYLDPSSPQQAAFHEGFADTVALLSIFSLTEVVETLIDYRIQYGAEKEEEGSQTGNTTVDIRWLDRDKLKDSMLLGLGKEIGQEMPEPPGGPTSRRDALRRSVRLRPRDVDFSSPEFQEPHRLGEVFVAAMMNTFLDIWTARLEDLKLHRQEVDRARVAEEGGMAADHLLTMAVRALDYAPATDLQFSDFLSAMLTADLEVQPDDRKFQYRKKLREAFAKYKIAPASKGYMGEKDKVGVWEPPDGRLDYSLLHFESMQRDPDEIFRFIWQNRDILELEETAYTRVLSVRPCMRVSSDGFPLHETVAEYVQMLTVRADELQSLPWKSKDSMGKFPVPDGMPPDLEITIYGGGALVFNEYGQLKYHVRNKILNAKRQRERLDYLWKSGFFDQQNDRNQHFADLHRMRWMGSPSPMKEEEYESTF